ncbi:phage distal tail protein domain-containing protein [Helicobacter rodentium]|uniref:phage distal tail protein domain-containing protein n=1 Tax=Helicobacter rodentium TaxID=59617 RepID=UPI002628DC86|nr:phage baseplate protein [Helicobacter rodentium]
MRKFYLHTINKSKTFDLNTDAALATEPTGLGNAFDIEYKKSEKGQHLVNVKPNFDPIKLKIYFNANNTNAYLNYKSLLSFLAECGTSVFLFEYNDGITDKFCEIVSKTLPKSEIDTEGVFVEEFVFERQTYWYEEVAERFALKNTSEVTSMFPLSFPFGFAGKVLQKRYKIINNFYMDAPITILISGNLKNNINIYIMTLNEKIVGQIQLSTNNTEGTEIIIEPTTKKISVIKNNQITNGYALTDKTKQSFLYLPQGEYFIGSNIDDEDTGKIEISIKRYLFD